ncbi:MAG: S24/S26 family peptidase [Lachnospiraceae bacterium]|nr:S24/S26 family peptidase [Lachnospiraceae bacterium]
MKKIDTRTYVSMLRELVEEGREVSMVITGSSMSPFLIHERDTIFFQKPDRKLKRGDMVFYQRVNGQFVMHRIYRVRPDGYDIVGDAQQEIERGILREQIFALVTKVERKGKMLKPGDFLWEFFAGIWLFVLPIRHVLMRISAIFH